MIRQYRTIREIEGPLLLVRRVEGAAYGEFAEIALPNGETRRGRVLEVDGDAAVVQLFDFAHGLGPAESKIRFLGRGLELPVSEDMLGRVFDGMGTPIDGGPALLADARRDINGQPTNPTARVHPSELIQTGFSAIDGLHPLVRGQKLSIFSGAGLPHAALAARLALGAHVPGGDADFVVVFAAIGVSFEEAGYFAREFRRAGILERTVLFTNLMDGPVLGRLAAPRAALTAAEYLAFERNRHVLVLLTDLTSYAEAFCELSAARREPPLRRGFPASLRTDFASLCERAGRRLGKEGSITLLPILTMPGDDITHPIPDAMGSVTEGQLVLSRPLHRRGIFPPVDPLASQSRLRGKAAAWDHTALADALLTAYAKAETPFPATLERRYLHQGSQDRTLKETLSLGRKLLSAQDPT